MNPELTQSALPALLRTLVMAHDLESLDEALRGALAEIFAPAKVRLNALLVRREAYPGCVMIIEEDALGKGRYHRPWRLSPWGESLLAAGEAGGVRRIDAPGRLLGETPPPGFEGAGDRPCRLVPLRGLPEMAGAWLIGIDPDIPDDDARGEEQLMALADAIALTLRHVLHHDADRLRHRQSMDLHEAMLRALLATNRDELLNRLLGFVTRQLGLERVFVALINPMTQMLRSELHTGFGTDFTATAMSMRQNFFVWVTDRGEVEVLESACCAMPEAIPRCDDGAPPELAVLVPLRVGTRPIGLLYADTPRHAGRPIFPEVLALLSRLAGCALANLHLRISAEQRAETDPLTGLRNRFFLDRVLDMEIPRVKRYNQPISMLMIDLCDFKHVNDSYGHQFGDYLLRESAQLLQANVRRPDFVIRYGGDEFLVLMVNTTVEQADLVRRRIEKAFIERNRLQTDEKMIIRISIGMRSADASNIDELLNAADRAMYAQKAGQRRRQLLQALLQGSLERIEAADRVVGSLCNMLFRKAPDYIDHARRVAETALLIASRLGLDGEQMDTIALAALLHDVGKVSLPSEVLRKATPLTVGEAQAVRHHPALGDEFFEGVTHLEPIRPLIRSHHERYDGQMSGEFPGYPDGLSGERIPLGGRILKIAESVDVMLVGHPGRTAMVHDAVEAVLQREAGRSFDPRLVRVLLADDRWRRVSGDAEWIGRLLRLDQP